MIFEALDGRVGFANLIANNSIVVRKEKRGLSSV
jgi:hypothetical protein